MPHAAHPVILLLQWCLKRTTRLHSDDANNPQSPTMYHNVVNTKGLIVYHPETNSASSDKHGTGTTKEELLCQVENNGEESEGARQDRQCIKTARHR